MRIYLGDPKGLSEANQHFHEDVLVLDLEHAGHEVIGPWTMTCPTSVVRGPIARKQSWLGEWQALNGSVGDANFGLLRASNAFVCLLDGRDMPSVTAAGMGYAHGTGIPIFVLRANFGHKADRDETALDEQAEFLVRASGGIIAGKVCDLIAALDDHERRLEAAAA